MEQCVSGERWPTKVCLLYSKVKWQWRKLVEEAESWEDGKRVNWTNFAKQYGIHQPLDPSKLAVNGGQIARTVLEDAGIDTTRFLDAYGRQTGRPRARRSRLRTKSGVAVPQHTPLAELQGKKRRTV